MRPNGQIRTRIDEILNAVEEARIEEDISKLQTVINPLLPEAREQLVRISESTDIDLLYHAAQILVRLTELEYAELDKELTVRRMMSIAEDCQS